VSLKAERVIKAGAVKGKVVKAEAARVRVVLLPLRPPLQLMLLPKPPQHEISRSLMRCSLPVNLRVERAVVTRVTGVAKAEAAKAKVVRVWVALLPLMPPLVQLKHPPKYLPQGNSSPGRSLMRRLRLLQSPLPRVT
jgi:hypothetical protein